MYKVYIQNKIRVGKGRERTIAWLDRLCWLSRDQHALFATLSWSYLAPGTSPKVQQWQWDWWCRSFVFGFTFSFTSSSNTLIQFKRSSQSAGTTAERISIHITRVPSNLVAKRVILSPMTWMEKIWRLLNVFEEALRYFIISSWRHALVHSKSFKKSSWLCGVSCWLKGSCHYKQSLLKHPFGFFLTLSTRLTGVQPCPWHLFQVHQITLIQCQDDIYQLACMIVMPFHTYASKIWVHWKLTTSANKAIPNEWK